MEQNLILSYRYESNENLGGTRLNKFKKAKDQSVILNFQGLYCKYQKVKGPKYKFRKLTRQNIYPRIYIWIERKPCTDQIKKIKNGRGPKYNFKSFIGPTVNIKKFKDQIINFKNLWHKTLFLAYGSRN